MRHSVSVIVPVWNMARFLPDAVASIPNVHEIIIVAAPSEDDTVRVANELAQQRAEIRVVAGSDQGPASARNIGLRQATGDVIAFNDADDIWPRGKLDLQLARLDAEPAVDMVAGLVTYFDALDREALAPAVTSRIETVFFHQLGATVFRRSVFDRIGMFDESFFYAEDRDLFLRLRREWVSFAVLIRIRNRMSGCPTTLMMIATPGFDWDLFSDAVIDRELAAPATTALTYLADELQIPVPPQVRQRILAHVREPFLSELAAYWRTYQSRNEAEARAIYLAEGIRSRRLLERASPSEPHPNVRRERRPKLNSPCRWRRRSRCRCPAISDGSKRSIIGWF